MGSKCETILRWLRDVERPRYPQNAVDALQNIYEALVSPEGSLLSLGHEGVVRKLVRGNSAVTTIVRAIYRANASPQLFHRACGVLTLFSIVEANLVANQGGFEAIVHGMIRFPSIEYVQEAAIVALIEIGRETEYLTMDREKMVTAVLEAMDTHKRSSRIFYLASKSLRLSCQLGIVFGREIAVRARDNLLDGIFLFIFDEEIQNAGCDALEAWVGPILAIEMIQSRAVAFCTWERILRAAIAQGL